MPTPRSRGLLLRRMATPPTYVDVASVNNNSGTTTVTIPVPTGGSLLVAVVGFANAGTISGPGGAWTLVRTTQLGRSVSVWWKAREASEPPSYDWILGTSGVNIGVIISIAGANAAPEVENGQSNVSVTNVIAPSITTLGRERLLLYAGVANAQTISLPSGMDSRFSLANGSIGLRVATEPFASAGATGTRTGTIGGAANNVAQLMAFKGA